jgi:hypothetical protein
MGEQILFQSFFKGVRRLLGIKTLRNSSMKKYTPVTAKAFFCANAAVATVTNFAKKIPLIELNFSIPKE